MKLPHCISCGKALGSKAVKVILVEKKLSGNWQRKQFIWKRIKVFFFCNECYTIQPTLLGGIKK